jgi:hypothetical protein
MKKMMLLALTMALAALMLAAAPAFAQTPGNACEHEGQGVPPFCDEDDNDDGDDDDDIDFVFCDFNDDGNDDGDDCEFNVNDRDRDIFRNIGNVDVSPVIDISQETDQDCDTGDVSQPISVDSGGDNSVTTVGLQPTANTGCAQNATGILQAAPIVAGLGGDTIFAPEDNNGDDNGDDVDLIRCDRDGDGNDDGDDCDDFDNDRVFCDRDGDGNDDGDDDCFVLVNDDNNNGDNGDRDVFRNIGNDELNITGPDFGDVDVDSDASIDLSPSQVINGGGEVNQAAAASSTQQWILTPKGWLLV